MVWAIDALQSERVEAASRYISFPAEAAASDMASKFAVYKWELETLIRQLLVTPKIKMREGPNRLTDCTQFTAGAKAVDHLRNLEDAEAAIYLKRFSVFNEMHRIGQRQVPWQRGYLNVVQFYRCAYIYGQGPCADYFERTNGLTISDFSLVGFGLYTLFLKSPVLARAISFEEVGITAATVEATLTLLSTPIAQARSDALQMIYEANKKHGSPLPVAYQPSFIRRFPIISFGNGNSRLRASSPDLILLRITSGLYYDLVAGGSRLRNEASDRFESYCAEYIAKMMRRFDVARSYRYTLYGKSIDTPDILVKDRGEVVVVVECKATKLTFGAQFADDPIADATRAYDEIAKGVFQLWRYFSHVRRGIVTTDIVRSDAHGMVLTLDTWLVMSRELQERVLTTATTLAERDQEIIAEDRRTVVFCAVEDLERFLTIADEDSFLRAIAAVGDERFVGWVLPNIHRETEGAAAEPKSFPFQLGDVLPWWDATGEMRQERQKSKTV